MVPGIVGLTPLHLQRNLPAESSQFSTLRPTRLDEIKNLHDQLQVDAVGEQSRIRYYGSRLCFSLSLALKGSVGGNPPNDIDRSANGACCYTSGSM